MQQYIQNLSNRIYKNRFWKKLYKFTCTTCSQSHFLHVYIMKIRRLQFFFLSWWQCFTASQWLINMEHIFSSVMLYNHEITLDIFMTEQVANFVSKYQTATVPLFKHGLYNQTPYWPLQIWAIIMVFLINICSHKAKASLEVLEVIGIDKGVVNH